MPSFRIAPIAATLALGIMSASCSQQDHSASATSRDHMTDGATVTTLNDSSIAPSAASAEARLNASSRHGEYVMIARNSGKKDSLRAWIVYPERKDNAPVVVVVHEIFGLSTWVRSVADQLASEGFIAIAPDFLTGMTVKGAPDSVSMQAGVAATSKLSKDQVMRDIDAAAKYATSLPAAQQKFATIGFCWGGGIVFEYAAHSPDVATTVVYYGTSIAPAKVKNVRNPVIGFYGGNDARVDATIPPTDSAMKAQAKTFEHYIYEGAGHGFLRQQERQQDGADGANLAASRKAWPSTISWLQRHLGS